MLEITWHVCGNAVAEPERQELRQALVDPEHTAAGDAVPCCSTSYVDFSQVKNDPRTLVQPEWPEPIGEDRAPKLSWNGFDGS